MNIVSTLSKITTLSSLWMGASCVAAGAAAAALHGNLELIPLSICLIFGIAAQFSINFLHRYTDEKYQFGENESEGLEGMSPFSTLTILKEATTGAVLITGMIGLVIVIMGGPSMLIFGAALTLFAWFINAGRHPLDRTPVGVSVTALCYGPIGTLAVCFLQSQRESVNDFNMYDLGPALYMGFALAFYIGSWKITRNLGTIDNDRKHNKRTLSVTIGATWSRVAIVFNALCALAIIVAASRVYCDGYWIWVCIPPVLGLIAYVCLSVALKGLSPQNYSKILNMEGILMFLVMVLIFVVFCVFSEPFDTNLTLTGHSDII